MAITLNSTDRANILQAITLIEKGTAPDLVYPSGIHDDIVELVGRAADRSGFESKGKFKDLIANAPITTLLDFIVAVLVSPNAHIVFANNWLKKSTAAQLPLDAQINYELSLGFSAGSFDQQLNVQQRLQDRPVVTLLRYLYYVTT
jgi:hypothetical protein